MGVLESGVMEVLEGRGHGGIRRWGLVEAGVKQSTSKEKQPKKDCYVFPWLGKNELTKF